MTPVQLLKLHEGFRAKMYTCPAGKRTIGYGYNLDANPMELSPDDLRRLRKDGISEWEAEDLLMREIEALKYRLEGFLPWWSKMNAVRKSVLINMAYNLGFYGLLKFTKTLSFIERGYYGKAADEMLNSAWAKQVGHRATELAAMMRTGKAA